MKRLIALLMLLALLLCACDSEEKTQPSTKPIATEVSYTGENGETIFERSNNVCLFENDACSLTLMKAEIDSLSDYCWDVTLVNRTENAQIFTFKRAYLNEFDFDPLWVQRVEAGQTLETSIIWQYPEMEKRGIMQITRVDFNLCVYEADVAENVIANTDITVFPSTKSAHIDYLRARETTDIDVVENEFYKFTIVGYDGDSRWGKELQVYAANNDEFRVVFRLENVTVNDQPCDPQWSYTLDGGKQGYSSIVWFDSALQELEIDGNLEFEDDLVICDENDTVLERVSHTFVP